MIDRFRYLLHWTCYGLGGLPHNSDHIHAQFHRFHLVRWIFKEVTIFFLLCVYHSCFMGKSQ